MRPLRLLALLLVLALAGCGFQMRGAASLPFETIYLPPVAGGVLLDLRRTIQAGSSTRVVDDPKSAQAILEFTLDERVKDILSLTAAGRVREFSLRYRVGFRVHDGKGHDYVPASIIALQRDVSFNDAEVLAKEAEESLLWRDMQSDMVQQLMRRLSGARAAK